MTILRKQHFGTAPIFTVARAPYRFTPLQLAVMAPVFGARLCINTPIVFRTTRVPPEATLSIGAMRGCMPKTFSVHVRKAYYLTATTSYLETTMGTQHGGGESKCSISVSALGDSRDGGDKVEALTETRVASDRNGSVYQCAPKQGWQILSKYLCFLLSQAFSLSS
jgi:hypothetical protein